MLYSVMLLGTFTVVEAVESAYEVACDTAYAVECHIVVVLTASAARTLIAYDACVSAARVTVNRMVDSAVADA